MRYSLLALAVAAIGGFAVASCGNGNQSGSGDMGADMAIVSGPDMATPKLNCLGVGNCILQCFNAGMGDIASCFQNVCSKQAKVGSAMKWSNAFICGQNYCDPPTDMMGKCVEVTVPPGQPGAGGKILCDPGQTYDQCSMATTPGVCANCISNARNLIWGDFSNPMMPAPPTGMCPDPASADCKGGAMCMTLMNACIADM
jgi:hypothetical protein